MAVAFVDSETVEFDESGVVTLDEFESCNKVRRWKCRVAEVEAARNDGHEERVQNNNMDNPIIQTRRWGFDNRRFTEG